MEVILWAGGLLAMALLGGWLIGRKSRQGKKSPDRGDFGRLVGACFGDAGKAERLMELERRGKSWLDRESAARLALDRLERDRYR